MADPLLTLFLGRTLGCVEGWPSLLIAGSCGSGFCMPELWVTVDPVDGVPLADGITGSGPVAGVVSGSLCLGGGGTGGGVLPPTRTVTVFPPLTFTTGRENTTGITKKNNDHVLRVYHINYSPTTKTMDHSATFLKKFVE